jgi:hypothetical protein
MSVAEATDALVRIPAIPNRNITLHNMASFFSDRQGACRRSAAAGPDLAAGLI